MKQAQWRAVYAPRGSALDERVKRTLSQLEERPEHVRPGRMVWLAAALILTAAVAVAAGLTRSARYDAKRLAHQALEEKYGFTQDMDSFFLCSVEEEDGQTVVTYRANEDVGDFAWKLGDYTVTIHNGHAEASWSNDGEAVGGDFSSDVWDTALLARGIARRKAGEEWYEITGETLETGEGLSSEERETVLVPEGLNGARLADKNEPDVIKAGDAVREKYGLTEENLALFDAWALAKDGKTQITFVPNIPAEDDGILLESNDERTADKAFASHSERMGRYTAAFDESDAVQSVSWTHDGEELPDVTESTWGRANVYDAKCLTELEKLLRDLQAIRAKYPDDGWTRTPEGDAALDARMVAAGFSAARYNHVLPEPGMLTEQDALTLARQALEGDGGIAAEALDDPENELYAVCQKEEEKTVWNVWFHNAEGICVVTLDAADGTILDMIIDTGMAGNG